jgi:hypothetical protein
MVVGLENMSFEWYCSINLFNVGDSNVCVDMFILKSPIIIVRQFVHIFLLYLMWNEKKLLEFLAICKLQLYVMFQM